MTNYRTIKIGPYSSYAIAKKNGFEGTEKEWLESLKPPAVDKTLTEEGQAADAKVTGDELARKAAIDDTTVGTDAWSSKHIVDMLCPPLEETGNPVVCYPVAGYPLGVKASWEPTQEGTGDPSPENVRPISGRDNVTVKRCGENLLDMSVAAETKNVTVDGDKIHVVDTSGWGESYIIFDAKFPPGTYTIAFNVSIAKAGCVIMRTYNADGLTADAEVTVVGNIYYASFNKYYKGYTIKNANSSSPWKIQFTVGNAAYFRVGFSGWLSSNSETEVDIINPMLVPGTTPLTTYSPYTGQTSTLTLPSTIYGGTVDAVTGESGENAKIIVVDGDDIKFSSASLNRYWNLPMKSSLGASGVLESSHFGSGTFSLNKNYEFIFTQPTVMQGLFSSVDELNAYCAAQYAAGTPVQIAYKLATPEPFTATGPQPIPALSGVNTLLTDADSVAVTGRADPIKRITDLEDAVASMT